MVQSLQLKSTWRDVVGLILINKWRNLICFSFSKNLIVLFWDGRRKNFLMKLSDLFPFGCQDISFCFLLRIFVLIVLRIPKRNHLYLEYNLFLSGL